MREHSIIGCILAGGLARRMGGGDKALCNVAGRPMLAHVIGRLAPQVNGLIINANGPPERFRQFTLPVVADTIADHPGPLAGVLAGMRWSQRHHPEATLLVTVSGDAPLIPNDLVANLSAYGPLRLRMISSARSRPAPARFSIGRTNTGSPQSPLPMKIAAERVTIHSSTPIRQKNWARWTVF
jgi:molybdenum cofactor guanylyltransferase